MSTLLAKTISNEADADDDELVVRYLQIVRAFEVFLPTRILITLT